MKRTLIILIAFVLALSGCKGWQGKKEANLNEKIIGVWISYSELDKMLLSGDFKGEFNNLTQNLKTLNITDAFVHVRPFSDSLYKSQYYPLRQTVRGYDFDVLEYMIDTLHSSNIKFHAWLNPYRIKQGSTDISDMDNTSVIYKWIEEKSENIGFSNGIYLNPSSSEAVRLIKDGIKEITDNYDIDGIHFDDYFYPTSNAEFDKKSYSLYSSEAEEPLELADWRRLNVNSFISLVGSILKNKNIIFSISPAASISKNYENLYADITYWSENNYADYIMPQLYFGFDYPDKNYQFEKLLDDWINLLDKSESKLIIGLAPYKIGIDTEAESEEWARGDIIAKQTEISLEKTDGVCYFSYSSLFGNSPLKISERENLTEYFNKSKA